MTDAAPCKKGGNMFGLFDRDRPDQHGLALFIRLGNFIAQRLVLVRLIQIDDIILIDTRDWQVCRNNNNVKAVNLVEFHSLGVRSARHARYFFVQPEIILKGNCRESAVALGDLDPFFCLYRLMKPVRITPAVKNTACKFIDNLNLAILHNIVNINMEKFMGF